MALVVMKFGGSSVSDLTKIRHVAELIIKKKHSHNKVIVVVSAPGDKTDEILDIVHNITSTPSLRELDMLLSTGEIISISLLSILLNSLGETAVALTGPQAGIIGNNEYTNAKITQINTNNIMTKLKQGNIVIVAGFQALNNLGDITTLGRGGSDLTAVALAATLKVDYCEIYSDVDGIYSVDPRINQNAIKLNIISYDEMLEMASTGAQVLQTRSVLIAKKFNIDIYSKGTFSNDCGTLITDRRNYMESLSISSITSDKDKVQFSITSSDNNAFGLVSKILNKLAQCNINVDMIEQPINNILALTVSKKDMNQTNTELKNVLHKTSNIICRPCITKISVIGIGLRNNTTLLADIFNMLHKNNIEIFMISTSEIRISFIVKESDTEQAINVLHKNLIESKMKIKH
ncbi:MAG: aspartate kinase [Endomicrobium sp.]|jgi:aspartate kinase|nr:aspartate kinase [Endomicrobium sp.]